MIPFARILKYGNQLVQPQITQLQASDSATLTLLALYDDNELWGIGAYGNNLFGDVQQNLTSWRKLRSDVTHMWMGSYGTLIKTTTGWSYSGYTTCFGGSSVTTGWNTAYSNRFAIFTDPDQIVDVRIGFNEIVVQYGTELYYIGNGSNYINGGMGGTSTTAFKSILSNVKSFNTNKDNIMGLQNTGKLFSCGYQNNGQFGTGNTTLRTIWALSSDNVVQVSSTYESTLILKTDGLLYSAGSYVGGQLGLGDSIQTGNQLNYTSTGVNVGVDAKLYADPCSYTAPTRTSGLVITTDNRLLKSGDNKYGQIGNGTTTQTWSFDVALPTPTVGVDIVANRSRGTYLAINNQLYGYGQFYGSLEPNSLSSSPTIIKLSNPK